MLNRNITLYAVWLQGEYELNAGYGYSTSSDGRNWIEKTFEIVVPRYVNVSVLQGQDYMTIGSPGGTETVPGSCYGTENVKSMTSGKTYGTISGLRDDFKKIVVTYNANPSTVSGVTHHVYTHKIILKLY